MRKSMIIRGARPRVRTYTPRARAAIEFFSSVRNIVRMGGYTDQEAIEARGSMARCLKRKIAA